MFVYDCPGQYIECGLYPWNTDPAIPSFGSLLNSVLNEYYASNNIDFSDCLGVTINSQWYDPFFIGSGPFSAPTPSQWVSALEASLISLQSLGYSYDINETDETVLIYNNNCVVSNDDFSINVGIEFQVLCNG